MKKTIVSATVFCAFIFSLQAAPDEKYVKAMEVTIVQLKDAKSPDQYLAVANRFELISKNEATEWLPRYYTAFTYLLLSFMEPDNSKKDQMIEKAETLINTLPENDEVMVLKAFCANAYMVVSPQTRWMTYGPKFEEYLGLASKINPENPRVYHLKGSAKFYTPEQFGGGTKVACPILEMAKAKFEAFKPASSIAPTWGLDPTLEMIKSCK